MSANALFWIVKLNIELQSDFCVFRLRRTIEVIEVVMKDGLQEMMNHHVHSVQPLSRNESLEHTAMCWNAGEPWEIIWGNMGNILW